MSVLEYLRRGQRLSSNGPALIHGSITIDYATFIDAVESTAKDLRAAGISHGDVVGVLAPNHPSTLIASYAAMVAGATYLPIPASESARNIASLLDRFDASMLAFHPDKAAVVADARPSAPAVRYVPITPDATRHVLETTGDGADTSVRTVHLAAPALTDIPWLGVTGGTTGLPKGVEMSWLALNAFVQKYVGEVPAIAPVMLLATPLTHGAGMLAMPTFARGGTVVVAGGLVPRQFLDLIEEHRITECFLPPTGIYKLLDEPTVHHRDFGSLTNFIYGAAPISIPRLRQATEVFGPVMTQAYGQTECHTLVTIMKPADHFRGGDITGPMADDARLSGCGWPTIGTTIEIRGDNGSALPPGQAGEICIASDLAMTGYRGDDDATAATLQDGFVLTGDIGFIDADGCLHLIDRKKDLVISGGFNIYPAEVEAALRRHPGIADCVVVGLPDDYWGEVLAAALIAEPGVTVDTERLAADLRRELGPVKTPKHFVTVASFPQSGVGKILKKDVRLELAALLSH